MRKLNFKTGATALAAAGLWVCASTSAIAGTVDLTSLGASGSIGAADFVQVQPQATGTGFIDPFLRVQANGNEAGYNTSVSGAVFDDKTGIWTHDLLISTLAVVDHNGVPSYEFSLDINQTSANPQIFLNQLQVYKGDTANLTGGSVDATTGRLTPPAGLTLVYDMNPGGGTANNVKMDYSLNSGSGSGDVLMFLPASLFAGATYLTLFNQFGNPPSSLNSNDGFEEWAAILGPNTPIPEPTTVIAGALLLLPFGASTLRVLRNRKA